MTKPLAFVLQLTGFCMLLTAIIKVSVLTGVGGVVLMVIGGVGIRRRIKK